MDMNDRALRNVVVGLGGKVCGFPRQDAFTITVASEIMAILCLAKDLEDLKPGSAALLSAATWTATRCMYISWAAKGYGHADEGCH